MHYKTKASRERYEKAKELMAGGATKTDAVKSAGMGMVTFYKFEKENKSSARSSKKKKEHAFVDMVREPSPSTSVAVIFCTPEQLSS